LVAWLNELLYLFESEGLGFKRFHVRQLNTHALRIQAIGAPVHSWQKYIKAATYSNLSIQTTATGVETTIVLDV
jgi:SHS2 domain-containing protein